MMKKEKLKLSFLLLPLIAAIGLLVTACGSKEEDYGKKRDVNQFQIGKCLGEIADTGYTRYDEMEEAWYIESDKDSNIVRNDGGVRYYIDSFPQEFKVDGIRVYIIGNIFEYVFHAHNGLISYANGWNYYYIKVKKIELI